MRQIGQLGLKRGNPLLQLLNLIQPLMNIGIEFLILFIKLIYFVLFLAGFLEFSLEGLVFTGKLLDLGLMVGWLGLEVRKFCYGLLEGLLGLG